MSARRGAGADPGAAHAGRSGGARNGDGADESAPAAYVGNADAAAIAARFRSAKSAVVTTHAKPDGDAVGSVLATLRMLRACGAEGQGWLVGPVDLALRAFLEGERIGDPRNELPAHEPDLVVVVDTGSWSQLDAMAAWVRDRAAKAVLIDHHRGGDPAVASTRLIDATCASTTQLLLRVVDALGLPLAGAIDGTRASAAVGSVAPPRDAAGSIAEALFIGVATDTGWFRFSNADAAVFDVLARLLRAGVSKDRLYRQIEETARLERMRLLARALASLELRSRDRVAVMVLTRDDFAQSGGGPEDLSGLINEPMAIGSVEMSILVSESEPGMIKLSFRSKPPIRIGAPFMDVNAFAAKYGGGGHVHAAGAKAKGTLATVLERLRRDLDALP